MISRKNLNPVLGFSSGGNLTLNLGFSLGLNLVHEVHETRLQTVYFFTPPPHPSPLFEIPGCTSPFQFLSETLLQCCWPNAVKLLTEILTQSLGKS